MNRTRIFVTLLGALFVASVGAGVVLGQEDEPGREIAATDVASIATTTTTVARTTTTKAPTTTTTAAPTTTVAPTTPTTRRPVVTTSPATASPAVTEPPPSTSPPVTDPPTTTTTALGYDPLECASINNQFAVADRYDEPARVALLKLNGCPPYYW